MLVVATDVDDDDDYGMDYEDDLNDVEGELAHEVDEENECDDEDDDEARAGNGEDEEDDNGDQLVKDFMGEMLQDVEDDDDRTNGLLAIDDDNAIAVNIAQHASTVNRLTNDPTLLLMDAALSD